MAKIHADKPTALSADQAAEKAVEVFAREHDCGSHNPKSVLLGFLLGETYRELGREQYLHFQKMMLDVFEAGDKQQEAFDRGERIEVEIPEGMA